jgi:glycerophosphoryl diester phosphodiesterase
MRRNFIVICALVVGLAVAVPASAIDFPAGKTLKIGHRGARGLSDENTLESLKLAVELGVDMLEFDIQVTRDNVFVLMHDETADRTTNGHGRVDAMTAAEFTALTTGRSYHPPTFADVLAWLKTNQVGFIIDMKITDPAVAKALIAMVEQAGLIDRAVFESPDPKVAGMIEQMRPELITALYPTDMWRMRHYLKEYNIDVASYQYALLNPLELALARRQGRQVVVWTVDKKGLINWFIKLKVNGIMTDDPNLFPN